MEMYYERAMKLDPNNLEACKRKMTYIEPKWYGNRDAVLEFARELARGQNWDGMLPFLIVEAHSVLASYTTNRANYFLDPEVWRDIRPAFEPYLRAKPNQRLVRTRYAKIAIECGQHAIAHEQFQFLGNNYSTAIYSAGEYQQHRDLAARLSGN